MKIPVELLADNVNENRVFAGWKFVHSFCPERNGKSEQQDCFDQNDGKLQVSRDAAAHAVIIGTGMPALAKPNQDENEKGRPTDEKRAHEPVGKFEDMIDLVTMLGRVRRLTE